MIKKKILIITLLALLIIPLTACGKTKKLNINDYVIEKREGLYTACDELYCVSLSTGTRESNYNFDGIVNEMVPFGVLTITRADSLPLANDTYSYLVSINDQTYSGFLKKASENSYSADLEVKPETDAVINVQISFTGYTFNKDLENTSSLFQVDSDSALKLAQEQLIENIEDILSDKNVKIEVVMKTMRDYSNHELKNYYWYVGVISTNGDTLGILLDANSGEIIAKKV